MKALLILLALVSVISVNAQFDPLTNPMVYHEPAMDKVVVKKGVTYKTHHADTVLKFDLYYPVGYDKSQATPVVIFNNGVGGTQVPEWRIYQDWARLMAAHGMVAINHQSRPGKTQRDLDDLLQYIRNQATDLKIDKENIGIWACSANTPTGWAAANNSQNQFIRAVAIYYGFIPPQQRTIQRNDVEILLVRAGLDSHNINIGMEELMMSALRTDAHVEYINYPEGQHAFDGVDHTPRSKEIILQTVDFFKRNLLGDNTETKSTLISNRQFWNSVLAENKTDNAIAEFRKAFQWHDSKPVKYPFWNQILNENNLNGLGYQLLQMNRTDDAIKIFKLNVEYFKDSPNAYDALADAYERKDDKKNTLINAKLALEKLKAATNVTPQFANAIRESAEIKINNIDSESTTPYKRAHHEVVYDAGTKTVLLIGGSTPLNGGQSFKFFNDIWSFDGTSWKKIGNAGDERSGIRTAYDTKRKKLYSYGGFTRNNQSSGQLRVLENGEWKVLTDIPEMKAAEPGFVYDEARDRFIAFGGSGSRDQTNNSTWEWDGINWKKHEGTGPGARQAFVMVYDTKRKKTVLFGGIAPDQKRLTDTWEYDGKKWTKVSEDGPGARMTSGYAYDSKRGLVVIFGGMSDSQSMNDTWGWNGKAWTKLADNGPSPRMMGYMAYDQSRDRIVMFGGRLGWPNDANDTWEWDGIRWNEIKSVKKD